jgi:membrane protein
VTTSVSRRRPKSELGILLKRTVVRARDHDLTLMAAGLSYYAFLAFLPLLLLLALAYGLVADPATAVRHLASLASVVSPDVSRIIGDIVIKLLHDTQELKGLAFTISLIVALYAGVRGARALTKALNIVHETKSGRSFVAASVMAIIIVFAALIVCTCALIAIGVLGYLEAVIRDVSRLTAALIKLATWIGVAAVASAAISALYRYAPAREPRQRRRWITVGAMTATSGWLVATLLLGIYVANFSRYDALYGSVATMIILLIWFFLSAMIILVGAEIDAILDGRFDQSDNSPGSSEF